MDVGTAMEEMGPGAPRYEPPAFWVRFKAWLTKTFPAPPTEQDVGRVDVTVTFDNGEAHTWTFTGWWTLWDSHRTWGQDATYLANEWVNDKEPIDLDDGRRLPRHRVAQYEVGPRREHLRRPREKR